MTCKSTPPNFQCVSRLTLRAALLAALSFGGSAALADGHGRGDFYVGGGVSSVKDAVACPADYSQDNAVYAAIIHPTYPSDGSIPGKCEDKERGHKIFAGYRAHENFGAEFGYLAADGYAADARLYYDVVESDGSTSAARGDLTTEADASLFYLAGVGYFPVSDGFSLLGKAGVHRWEKESTVNFDSVNNADDESNLKVKEDGIGILAGIGAQYDLAALPLSLRAEYEYARLNSSSSLRLLSLSLLWRF